MQKMPSIVAVTGALGFVGSRLVPALIERNVRVVTIVRREPGNADLALLGRIEIRLADLSRRPLNGVFAGAEAVVHLAGLSLVPTILPALLSDGVRAGVFVSSAGIYTRLKSASADAKRAGEASL